MIGKNKKTFIIRFDSDYFNRKDILTYGDKVRLKVVKVYKFNLWRRLLSRLGIKFKMFNCIKIKDATRKEDKIRHA